MNQTTSGKQEKKRVMPKELRDYVESLPGPMTNNSREIVRRDWERMKGKHPVTVENFFISRYGIDLDLDTLGEGSGGSSHSRDPREI